jgi:HEPN domain-containing protein
MTDKRLLDEFVRRIVDIVHPERHVRKASVLTAYAVQTRYPGDYEPVSETEFREVLEMATHVFDWAKAAIVNR